MRASPFRCVAAILSLAAAPIVLVVGCAHESARAEPRLRRGEHAIRVNSTASAPVKPGVAFVVAPPARDPGAESTLMFSEAARLVKSALMQKGLYEAPTRGHAGVVVEVEFSMETPRVSRATTASDPAAPSSSRKEKDSRAADSVDVSNLRASQRGTLEKTLVLTAREAKSDGSTSPRTLWTVELSTTDTSNDLRKYLPLLAAAAVDQIGVDSDGPQTVRISETDKTVALIRQAK